MRRSTGIGISLAALFVLAIGVPEGAMAAGDTPDPAVEPGIVVQSDVATVNTTATTTCTPTADGGKACVKIGGSSPSNATVGESLVNTSSNSTVSTMAANATPQLLAAPKTAIPWRPECSKLKIGVWYKARTWACAGLPGTLTVLSDKGIPTGSATFTALLYEFTDVTTGVFGNQMEIAVTSATGTAVGRSLTITPSCTGGCVLVSKAVLPKPLARGVVMSALSSWKPTRMNAGDLYRMTPRWNMAPIGGTTAIATSPTVRCDNVLGGSPRKAGCVVDGTTVYITYSKAVYPTFSAHVIAAQKSGLPGGSASKPLTRTTSSTISNANRSVACPSAGWLPRPTGKSCDEYPFASTYQGASRSGGNARTFSGCSVKLIKPASTGAKGFSICMINAAENTKAGSVLNSTLFVPKRVLDGDKFYVAFQ